MTKKQNYRYSGDLTIYKIVEIVLLIASVGITALPAFLCVLFLGGTLNGDLHEPVWKAAMVVITTVAGILGFFAQLIRIISIFTRSVSQTVTIGLISGLCAYLCFIISAIPDLKREGLLIVYSIPIIAILFSLRNIYAFCSSDKL